MCSTTRLSNGVFYILLRQLSYQGRQKGICIHFQETCYFPTNLSFKIKVAWIANETQFCNDQSIRTISQDHWSHLHVFFHSQLFIGSSKPFHNGISTNVVYSASLVLLCATIFLWLQLPFHEIYWIYFPLLYLRLIQPRQRLLPLIVDCRRHVWPPLIPYVYSFLSFYENTQHCQQKAVCFREVTLVIYMQLRHDGLREV